MIPQSTRAQWIVENVARLADTDPAAFTDVAGAMLRLMLTYQRFSYDLLMCRALNDTLQEAGFMAIIADLRQHLASGDVNAAQQIAIALEDWGKAVQRGALTPAWLRRASYCAKEGSA